MPEIFDTIELWADTHQFVTCCLMGFVGGLFYELNKLDIKPVYPWTKNDKKD